jgi:hypothetical protein
VEKLQFPPIFWHELARENPLGRNDITARDARDWFDLKWPIFEEYAATSKAKKPNHTLRVKLWWHKLTDQELERARAYGAESRRGERARQLSEVASKVLPSETRTIRADLPPLTISRGGKRV